MNTYSKFGISTKQSLIAFVVMLVLIIIASGFADQPGVAQAGLPGEYDYTLALTPTLTPTVEPIKPVQITPTAPPAVNLADALPSPSDAAQVNSAVNKAMAVSDLPQAEATAQTFSSVLSDLLSMAKDKLIPHNPAAYTIYMPSIAQGVPPTPIPPTPTTNPLFIFTPQEANITDDEGRSWNDYAGPSIWPDLEVPAPAGLLAHPEDQINILLLGSDQREGDSGFRTDTIQLLTINPSEGSVKLTSFPRDLYVNIPGYTMQRINTAFGWGGFDALADTMEYNFGVRPEYYVLINLWSFVDVIDSIGGITVDIGKDLCDHRDNWGGDFCVSQGTMWMGGRTALWYVRSRYTSSDLDRGRRQQEVLEGAFKQVISLNGLSKVPELYEIYRENVSTNIPLSLAIRLIPVAAHQADESNIDRYSIGAGQVYNWTNYSGAMVLVPVREPVMDVMREVISEP